MKIKDIIVCLETLANPGLQESYDNVGLLTGNYNWECSGIICTLDATEDVIAEAIAKRCNLVVAHHPIIFGGLKRINGTNYVERTIIAAIKNDIAIYTIHTNLDNVLHGVNNKIAEKLGLIDRRILHPKSGLLSKLHFYVPIDFAAKVRDAIFSVGAGEIGNYSENSFSTTGFGTFKGNNLSQPFIGKPGERATIEEQKIEIIFPNWLQNKVINALKEAHPYEEVAYEIVPTTNKLQMVGSGLVGHLPEQMDAVHFLHMLKNSFDLQVVRHTNLLDKPIQKVAVCGGAGSFLLPQAIQAGADIFITADMKYHEFFDADQQLVIADIGHWESEQFTIELLIEVLQQNFPTFAVLKSKVKTNPVQYFL
jgi:dinuclear metal center YbgI/SA1388 family protein